MRNRTALWSGISCFLLGAVVGLSVGLVTESGRGSRGMVTTLAAVCALLVVAVIGGWYRLRRSRVVTPRSRTTSVLWKEFSLELDRSRRYKRACSIIRLFEPDSVESEQTPSFKVETRLWAWGHVLRNIDRVWYDDGYLFLMLPETDRAGARAFLARVRQQHPSLVPHSDITVASFPEDGLTYGAVLNTLYHPVDVGATSILTK